MLDSIPVSPLLSTDFKGTFLLLINPEKIPHLAIVQNASYFSLTNKTCIINHDFIPYFESLVRAKKRLLFIELRHESSTDFTKVFSQYSKVNNKTITCLSPVKESLAPLSKAQFIFELVPELIRANRFKSAQGVNMDALLDENQHFTFTTYSQNDIFHYIEKLNKNNARKQEN